MCIVEVCYHKDKPYQGPQCVIVFGDLHIFVDVERVVALHPQQKTIFC